MWYYSSRCHQVQPTHNFTAVTINRSTKITAVVVRSSWEVHTFIFWHFEQQYAAVNPRWIWYNRCSWSTLAQSMDTRQKPKSDGRTRGWQMPWASLRPETRDLRTWEQSTERVCGLAPSFFSYERSFARTLTPLISLVFCYGLSSFVYLGGEWTLSCVFSVLLVVFQLTAAVVFEFRSFEARMQLFAHLFPLFSSLSTRVRIYHPLPS